MRHNQETLGNGCVCDSGCEACDRLADEVERLRGVPNTATAAMYMQEAKERVEHGRKIMEAFEAMREALHAIVQERFLQRPESSRLNLAIDEGNAAAMLAERVSRR